jgi:acetolactate synthase-1/2/3 large subunit
MVEGDNTYRVVLDGGNTCLWVGMLMDAPGPGRCFFPTGMGTLGSGLPMAIGIKKAVGDARVILISGDGSFLYNMQEFETLRKYNIQILVVVFNDSAWNMIRTAQLSLIGHIQGTDIPYTDYARAAQSYGCFGAKVAKKDDIDKAVRAAMESHFPAVVDFEINRNAAVYPFRPGQV